MLLRLAGPVALPVDDTLVVSAAHVTPHREPSRGRCPGTRAGGWPGHRHLRDAALLTQDARQISLEPCSHHQRRYHGGSVRLRHPSATVSAPPPTMWFLQPSRV